MDYSKLFSVSLVTLSFLLAGCQTVPAKDANAAPDMVAVPLVEVDKPQSIDLEKRVSVLEGQMKAAQPTLKKVEVMERHFKSLSFDLDKIATDYPVVDAAPAPVLPIASTKPPEPKKLEPKILTPQKAEMKKPVVDGNVFAVTSVRIGDQPKNITRIVLDTTKPAEIRYDLDNAEKLLVIDIPKAQWTAGVARAVSKSPLVKSYQSTSDDTGSRLIVELKETAKVVATSRLTPSGASGNRVYVDIAPAK